LLTVLIQGGKMDKAKIGLHLIETVEAVSLEEKAAISQVTQTFPNDSIQENGKQVKQTRLINKLNYLNFQDRDILIVFKHLKYDHTLPLEAKPQPCQNEFLECYWSDAKDFEEVAQAYGFESLLVPDGQKLLEVRPEIIHINEEYACFKLPEICYEVCARKVSRHSCKNIHAHLIQNGTVFKGRLLDFNAVSFRVQVTATPPQSFQWLNPESAVTAIFADDNETFYTGDCKILNQNCGQKTRQYILEPRRSEIQRFKHKEFRSARQKVTPSPNIVFKHPFTRKLVSLKAIDLSGSGFAVEEDAHSSVLLPGLMISELELNFANSLRYKCKAQVVYRQPFEPNKDDTRIKCGLALLDMDIEKHVQLVALLQQAENENSYICNKVDLDELWDFFFETGFIYPDKYEFIQKNKNKIKETYEKLYTRNPNIARHFIYQEKGHILGHMAMVRFYENTWLIHHHAARRSDYNRAGLIVLNQIGRFGNDSHRLYSIHMDFLLCYYRPQNKFPSRVFGGAVRNIRNPKGCSEDLFAFLHFQRGQHDQIDCSAGWELSRAQGRDLRELEKFYEHASGGLMLNALNLDPEMGEGGEIELEFEKLGFKRSRSIYALRKKDILKAIFMVDLTDIGLNLSDLTNCIRAIVLDSEDVTKDLLNSVISEILKKVELEEMPVLIYPASFVEDIALPFEKHYNLWVINLQHTDDYFRYLNRLLQFFKQ